MNNIAVIGGGPAGMIAAGFAKKNNNKVVLFESNNKLGKKLFITGKGRCNLTNNKSIEDFFQHVNTNSNFLYSSLYSFTNLDVLNLLNTYGLKTKVERGERVFPLSDKSSDVIKAFEKFLNEKDVIIKLNEKVLDIKSEENNGFKIKTARDSYTFDKVIIATGGLSYPTTGSNGDGYEFARKFGHEIIDLRPSLVGIELYDRDILECQGLTLKNVKLNAENSSGLFYSDFGELLITHFGFSGPLILTLSSIIHKYTNEDIILSIDLKPGLKFNELDDRILRDFDKNKNKNFKNSLDDLLPKKLIPLIINRSKINGDKKTNQITKEERNKLVHLIKSLNFKFKNLRPIEEAIITGGGICVKDINPSTMESKIVDNLYFAGEIIDVDAVTGGFNLQIAYSTGFLAGINSKIQ